MTFSPPINNCFEIVHYVDMMHEESDDTASFVMECEFIIHRSMHKWWKIPILQSASESKFK